MTTLDAVRPQAQAVTPRSGAGRVRGVLLVCGIGSSLLYLGMNVVVPMRWAEYSVLAQTVSELSAIDAPTRALWLPLGLIYTLLLAAFGLAVRSAGTGSRPLLVAGSLLIAYGMLGLYWPPMHLRGAEPTLTDTLHILWSVATVLLMVLAIGFAAAALGARFRLYSIATLVLLIVFGTLTAIDAPRIAANLPTPWIGLWERIAIAAFMIWILVFALVLQRPDRISASATSIAGSATSSSRPSRSSSITALE